MLIKVFRYFLAQKNPILGEFELNLIRNGSVDMLAAFFDYNIELYGSELELSLPVYPVS
jgi:hypothetical protein